MEGSIESDQIKLERYVGFVSLKMALITPEDMENLLTLFLCGQDD
jgi:hypothetical protein